MHPILGQSLVRQRQVRKILATADAKIRCTQRIPRRCGKIAKRRRKADGTMRPYVTPH